MARVSQLLQVMILLNVKSVVKSLASHGYSIDTLNVTLTLKGTSVLSVAKDSMTPLTSRDIQGRTQVSEQQSN